jgi:hypothetical protein
MCAHAGNAFPAYALRSREASSPLRGGKRELSAAASAAMRERNEHLLN